MSPDRPIRKRGLERPVVVLAVLLLAGGAIRFWGLSQKGLFHFDEGMHAKEAIQAHAKMRFWIKSITTLIEEKATGRQLWTKAQAQAEYQEALRAGAPMRFARPLLVQSAAVLMFFVHAPDVALMALSALAGCLSIGAVYLIGRRFAGSFLGLLAAAMLAFSGYHVIYSRSAFADVLPTALLLFALLGMLHCLRIAPAAALGKRAFLSGLLCGMAFTANCRYVAPMAFCVVGLVLELAWQTRPRLFKSVTRFLLCWVGGFLVGPLLFEGWSHAEFLLARKLNLPFDQLTYIEQLFGQSHLHRDAFAATFSAATAFQRLPLEFPYLYARLTGFLPLLMAVIGLAGLFRRRRPGWLALACAALGPWVFFSLFSHTAARFFVPCVPFLSLAAAVPFLALKEGPKSGGRKDRAVFWLLAAGFGLLIGEEIGRDIGLVRLRSGYRDAVSYLESNRGTPRHISTQAHVTGLYAGLDNTAFPPATRNDLRELCHQGFRYYLVDAQARIGGFGGQAKEKLGVVEEIQAALDPVARIANPSAAHFLFWFEDNYDFWGTLRFVRRLDQTPWGRIEIYDLQPLIAAEAEGA